MIRYSFLLVFVTCLSLLSHAQAEMSFKEPVHDFGPVQAGSDTIWYTFSFTNTGSEALIIQDVKTSCDCTLAEWPKTAIQPGKTAVIRGGFKIEGKSGSFEKNIILIANTSPATTFLTIKGTIVQGTQNP